MWSRKEAIASSLPIELWPEVLESELDEKNREKYLARAVAMRLYFANVRVGDIERRTGIRVQELALLARRCLLLSSDGRILGFRALIPYSRIKPYKRSAPHRPAFPGKKAGHAGAMRALLDRIPAVEEELIRYIRQDAKNKEIPEYKLRARDLHKAFIKVIKQLGVSSNEWPFNTKYRGIRSIEIYMRNFLNQNFSHSVNTREAQSARAHLNVGTAYPCFLEFEEPYDAVEIDAYNIECHMTVNIETPEGTEIDLRLERIWLIAAVERASSATLAYTVVYRSEVTADDVLRVIKDAATKKWEPLQLTCPGLTYPPGTGLPSGVIPGAHGAIWSVTLFDGALAHLSKAVHERARKMLGFVINWGAVGHFERRPNVERTFNQISKDLFKRLPSTTGSNPFNGRAQDAEKKAVRYKIRAKEVEELLDVTFAQHNATPSEGISYFTPLGFLDYFLNSNNRQFMVRYLPTQIKDMATKFFSRQEVVVRGGLKTGRRPYVQLDRCHYSSPVLANSGHLIGQTLIVEIDDDDFRQVLAFLKTGAELGFLKVQGKWGATKHSRRTRKAINALASQRIITISEFDDPVQVYLQYLSTRSKEKKNKREILTPRNITEVTRVAREGNITPTIVDKRSKGKHNISQQVKAGDVFKRGSIMSTSPNFFDKIKNRR